MAMRMRPWPGALRGSNWRRDRRTGCAASVNLMPVPVAQSEQEMYGHGGRKRQFQLAPTPGTTLVAQDFGADIRAVMSAGERVYVVAGRNLWQGDADGAFVDRGKLTVGTAVGDGPAQLAWMGPRGQLVAAAIDGELAYFDEERSVITTEVTSMQRDGTRSAEAQPTVVGVQEFQGYFVYLTDEGVITASPVGGRALLDEEGDAFEAGDVAAYAFDHTNFAERSLTPDPWVAIGALSDILVLWGRNSCDLWQLCPNPGVAFPFEPIQGGEHYMGVYTHAAAAVLNDAMWWVGPSVEGVVRVWRTSGQAPEPVSTAAVDEWLGGVADYGALRVTGTAFNGRQCLAVRDVVGATWCLDPSVAMWHERATWDADAELWGPWDAAYGDVAGATAWVADEGSRRIGRIDASKTDAAGNTIRRQRIVPHLADGNRLTALREVKASVPADVKRVGLAVSRDGGESFGPTRFRMLRQSPWAAVGAGTPDGRPAARSAAGADPVRWSQLGAGRDIALSLLFPDGEGGLSDLWFRAEALRK